MIQQQFENHVLVPKVMARQVGVSAVTVIVALLIGGNLLGILGAILAVPTAAILQVLFTEWMREAPKIETPKSAPSSSRFAVRGFAVRRFRVGRTIWVEGVAISGCCVFDPVASTELGRRTANSRTATRDPGRYTRQMRLDPLAYLGDELDSLKEQNLYRRLRVLDDEQKAHTSVDHKSVVNLSSNNYLGLTTHPRLRQQALEAIEEFGVGTGSVRTIAGTMAIHMELERKLAEFKKVEAVVVFQSGFTANAGTVSAILTKDDVVISDELNHASIIDGCRLSRAAIKVFPHKDVDAARRIIKDLPAGQRKLLITDGVFSMDGDLGPLPALCELAEETGCIMMVDDAHASGVFGKNGRGTIDHFGMHGRVDVQVGTLSKAIGALGGYVAGQPRTSSSSSITAPGRSCSRPRIRRRSPPPASRRSTC